MRSIFGGMILGSLLSLATSFGYLYYENNSLSKRDSTEIFEVSSLDIPNFTRGDNPKINYEIDVKEAFKGTFKINVVDVSINTIVCQYTSKDEIAYEPKRRVSQSLRTLEWLLDQSVNGYTQDCYKKLPSGLYQLQINYLIRQNGYLYDYNRNSNFFLITESK